MVSPRLGARRGAARPQDDWQGIGRSCALLGAGQLSLRRDPPGGVLLHRLLGAGGREFRQQDAADIDDGEPQGSSGKPILEAIDKFHLTDTMVIVSRYFGGVKLGVGGLRRAMSEAAELCLINASVIEKLITDRITIEFDYRFMNLIMNLIESEKIKIAQNLSDEKCRITLDVRLSVIEVIKIKFSEITNGTVSFL